MNARQHDAPKDISELRSLFERRQIRKVRLGGFDVDGILRGKFVNLDKFFSAVEKGFGFCDVVFGWDIVDTLYDNAEVTGWQTGYPDAHAKIDLTTFRVDPQSPDTACFLVDFFDAGGKRPHPACPRGLLKRVAARAETSGFCPMFSAEFEFWVFRETPQSLREKHYADLTPLSPGMFGYSWVRQSQAQDFVHDIIDTMDAFAIDVEGIHTETGPGVWEAALRYTDVVEAADQAALFKTLLKEIAFRHELSVTFMAKWNPSLPGSSGHLHQSLWDSTREENLFAGSGKGHHKEPLSPLALKYLAGLLKTQPALTAIYAPFINSYRRYVPGMWAPLTTSWGFENRTCGVRAITAPGKSAARFELRQTAADINPYLSMAASLGAGLYGIDNNLRPPAPITGDATAPGVPGESLPTNLKDAAQLLFESEAARTILSDDFVDHYLRRCDFEHREYQKSVSSWELQRYFESV